MTSHETVNRRYSDLQTQLRLIFAADGRGLSEMVRAVEQQIPPTLSWELRAVAHIRNKVVHEGLTEIPRYFEPLCKEALATLKRLKAERKPVRKKKEVMPTLKPLLAAVTAGKSKGKAAKKPVKKAAVAKRPLVKKALRA